MRENAVAIIDRPRNIRDNGIDKTDSNETIILAVPPKPNQNRYKFKDMINYCVNNKKNITELTMEEKEQFKI